MSMISLRKIRKAYNPGLFRKKVAAVNGLDLDIRQGEVFGLIGPNGAGKSTTIRIMLGLTRPNSGKVLFRGKPPKHLALQREIGYLPENPYIYDHLRLDELLAFCGRVSGLKAAETEVRGERLMKTVDLWDSRKRPLRTYSKGMLQRAGICFSLLHDPSVVILDEPMSGLDPIGRKMVFDLIYELKAAGKTVFFCSHILSDVERLCDRIGMMYRGRLLREFEQKVFLEYGNSIHLVVEGLADEHLADLAGKTLDFHKTSEQTILSIHPRMLERIAGELSSLGARITGSRKEGISLEERFLQVIREDAS